MDATDEFEASTGESLRLSGSIIGFSGQIGSGKSTISKVVANRLGWPWASFGHFLRQEASRRGLDPSSRQELQALGEELISSGWTDFCRRALESGGWRPGQNLVVDGIRHIEAIKTIEKLTSPLEVKLVYVSLDEETRRTRALSRGMSYENLRLADNHPVEAQVRNLLRERADLTVDGTAPQEECASLIIEKLAL